MTIQVAIVVVHPEGALVLLLQILASLLEVRQLSPAGLSGTASTDTVTLAQGPHGLPDGHPARLAVVEVGQAPGVRPHLTRVQELSGNLLSEPYIVAASSPLPL